MKNFTRWALLNRWGVLIDQSICRSRAGVYRIQPQYEGSTLVKVRIYQMKEKK